VIWAVELMVAVGWAGPAGLARFGIGGWRGALLSELLVPVIFTVLGRYERVRVGDAPAGPADVVRWGRGFSVLGLGVWVLRT
jgi:hypothetical protein